MKLYTAAFVVILIAATYPTHATAEEYDYDIGVSYRNSNSDLETPLAFIGGDSFGTSTISNDSDALELSGTWYYSGLSDSVGPKSRATFLSRASSLSLAFSYIDESRFISSTGLTSPPLPPGLPTRPPSSGSLGNDTSGKLKADLRHVWQSSGWYGLAGVDRNAHYVGVGKYLGDTTALDFRVTEEEYTLSLSHIGSLGSTWQFGADLAYSLSDPGPNDDGQSYLAELSLFPTNNLEFGFQLTHQEYDFSPDYDSYEGFAGWFIREDIELRAWYEDNDVGDNPFAELDRNQFGIGVNVRF